MGERLRAFDWAATTLGAIDQWPGALRTTTEAVMASRFPSCAFWGPELVGIYNDAFVQFLGTQRNAFGQPFHLAWSDAWEQLLPYVRQALSGQATYQEDLLIPLAEAGVLVDRYFTFSYSPLFDDDGQLVGLLDTVMETTFTVFARQAEQRERERQQALLQQMPGFVAVLNGPDHVYGYVNDAYVAIAGARNFIGRRVRDVLPELAGQGFIELLDTVYRMGEPMRTLAVPIDLERPGAESERNHIDLLFEPIRDAAGVVSGIFVGGYDVTQRVLAEAELAATAARLQLLNTDLERQVAARTLSRGRTWTITTDLLCVINGAGFIEVSNPAWQSVLGWTDAELANRSFASFVHPDDLGRTQAFWGQMQADRMPVLNFQNRYRSRYGGWVCLQWVVVPDEDGLYYCSARDVTAENARQAELAERTAERDLLAQVMTITDTVIHALDRDYHFVAINQASVDVYQRLFGFAPRVGDNLLALLGPERAEHADAARAVWDRALGGEAFGAVGQFGDPAYARRHYEMKFAPLHRADGQPGGAFLIATDITDRLHEQAALANAQEALRQSQKMEAVGQLTGGIAHDFNNLLAGISGNLQLMKLKLARGQSDGLERHVEQGESGLRRAAALTQRLLAFSRRQTLDPKAVDANRLVAGMEELVRRTVGPGVEVEVVGAGGLWTTRVDPSQLENALLNLCINARDAMLPAGGRLTIETANKWLDERAAVERELPPGQYISLCVTDTGTGIAPEVAQRIFDPFFTTKPMGQGTGLGLSMVYGFVRQSGGQVRVYSELGQGTTMCLYLPRHVGEAEQDEPGASLQAGAQGDGETVLLIEDEATVRAVVSEVLGEAGYRVLLAEDGPAGLRTMQAAGRIDLLVTDVGLPGGLNGRQVADAGRSLRPGLQVLFITGYAENAAVGNGMLDAGMQVLTKPFEIAGLVNKVREMLDSPSLAPSAVL